MKLIYFKSLLKTSDQNGGVGRHTVPPRTTKRRTQQFKNKKQPELTDNRTVWKSDNQGDEEDTFIQTGRRGKDWQRGRRGPRSKAAAGGPSEVVDCGTGQARLQLADPTRWWLADPMAPHSRIDKQEQQGSEADLSTQGSSTGK